MKDNGLGALLREVAATERSILATARISERVKRGLSAKLDQRMAARRRTRRAWFVAAPVLAGAAALLVMWAAPKPTLTFSIGAGARAGHAGDQLVADPGASLPLRFSDGTVAVLGAASRLHVAAIDARGASLRLQDGHVDLDVKHRANTHWLIQAGAFEVTVTGTRFSVDWDQTAQAMTLVMHHGSVDIAAPHLPGTSRISVRTGQVFHGNSKTSRWELTTPGLAGTTGAEPTPVAAAEADAKAPAEAPAAAETPPRATTEGRDSRGRLTWQELAARGKYQDALALAERGGFEDACRRLRAPDLVLLGDVARLARKASRAEQAYKAARRRFPRADRPVFALGLVAFEQKEDFKGAAAWFDRYVKQFPNGALAREAAGRALESWHRAGNDKRAQQAAEDYLRRTPSGPYAPLAHQILGS